MNMALHVLFVPSWYPTKELPLNGAFFKDQALALKEAGLQVGVIYPERRALSSLRPSLVSKCRFQQSFSEEDGIPTVRQHGWNVVPRITLGALLWAASVKKLYRSYCVQFGKPDILHAHAVRWGGVGARAISRSEGKPYLVTEHSSIFAKGLLNVRQRELARDAFIGARRVICVSSELKRLLQAQNLIDSSKAIVVPNMVDTSFFTLPPSATKGTGFRFCSVGWLVEGKGIHVLLRAFASRFRDREVFLDLVGGGVERCRLEGLAAELGIRNQVSFKGNLDKPALREVLWNANALVHPSFYETFGLALVEAMATGLPVIATASGGPEDTVNERVGTLVPVRDEVSLADAMATLVQSEGSFNPAAIRRYAIDNFSKEVVARRIITAYGEDSGEKQNDSPGFNRLN